MHVTWYNKSVSADKHIAGAAPAESELCMISRIEEIQEILSALTTDEKVALYELLLTLQRNPLPAENPPREDPPSI